MFSGVCDSVFVCVCGHPVIFRPGINEMEVSGGGMFEGGDRGLISLLETTLSDVFSP